MSVAFHPSCSTQVKQWVGDAISSIRHFDIERFTGEIIFKVVAEPSAPGHQDMMCTVYTAPDAVVEIREGMDSADGAFQKNVPGWPETVKPWFMECIVHEVSHAWIFSQVVSNGEKTAVAGQFVNTSSGSGQVGTLADWRPDPSDWRDRIVEAAAEWMKDLIFEGRVYDNRTNWSLPASNVNQFANLIRLSQGADDTAMSLPLVETSGSEGSFPRLAHAGIRRFPWVTYNPAIPAGYPADQQLTMGPASFWVADSWPDEHQVGTFPSATIIESYSQSPNQEEPNLHFSRFHSLSVDRSEINGGVRVSVDLTMISSNPGLGDGGRPYQLGDEYFRPIEAQGADENDAEYVGWGTGMWMDANRSQYGDGFKSFYELYFMVGWQITPTAPTGPVSFTDFFYATDPFGENLLAPYQHEEILVGQTPSFNGILPVPPPLPNEGEGATVKVGWGLVCKRTGWDPAPSPPSLGLAPESGWYNLFYTPSGPGVIENWMTRNWTVDYSTGTPPPPFQIEPDGISAGDGPGDALRIAR